MSDGITDGLGHGEKRSRLFERAACALLEYPTLKEAAAAVEVNEKTLREWLKIPEFAELCRQLRAELLERVVSRLLALSGEAVDTLRANLKCESPAASNRAAELILDRAVKGLESLDLARQLAELRRELEGLKDDHGDAAAGGGPAESPGGDPPPAGGPPQPGPAPGGPGQHLPAGGPGAGPVATGNPLLFR